MVSIIGFLLFSGAMALSIGVIAASVMPQWRRIARLASGQVRGIVCTPLATLAHAERRIAVRRWASAPVPAPIGRLRAAA